MSPQVPGIVKPVERFTAKYKGKFTCHLLIFFFLYFSKTFLGGFSWLPCDITLARSGEGRWLGQTGTVRRVQSPVLASQCVASRSPAGLGEIEINTCQLYHSGQERAPHCLLTTISYLLLAYCNYDGWDRGTLWEQPFLFFRKKNCYRFSWTDNALDFIIWNVGLTGTDGHSFLSVTCSDFRLQWNVTQSKTFFSLVFTISFLILRRRVE